MKALRDIINTLVALQKYILLFFALFEYVRPIYNEIAKDYREHSNYRTETFILDAGCGTGDLIRKLKIHDAIFGHYIFKNLFIVGVDIYLPYLYIARSTYNDVVQADVRYLPFRGKSFDIVLSTEVIEHLTERDAILFIKKCHGIARRLLVVTTPVGHNPKTIVNEPSYQAHISVWHPHIFEKLGFKVRGLNGFKLLRGENGELKDIIGAKGCKIFLKVLSVFTQLVLLSIPSAAYQLLATKKLSQ